MMGAALAYYMVFAIGPLLVIATGVAGIVFGEAAAEGLIRAARRDGRPRGGEAGPGSRVLGGPRWQRSRRHGGRRGAIAVRASALVLQLAAALNVVFDVPHAATGGIKATPLPQPGGGSPASGRWCSPSSAPTPRSSFSPTSPPVGKESAGGNPASLVAAGGGAARSHLSLSPRRTPWRPVLLGAAVTAILLLVGAVALRFYLSFAGSAAFAAGPIVALLFFAYYMAQILIFGPNSPTFSRRWSARAGARQSPADGPDTGGQGRFTTLRWQGRRRRFPRRVHRWLSGRPRGLSD